MDLFVSAENSQFNNYMAGPQVIEVVVIDSDIRDTDEAKGEPTVTVNNAKLRMVQAVDGNWYGFFADRAQAVTADTLQTTDGAGLDFGKIAKNPFDANVIHMDIGGDEDNFFQFTDGVAYDDDTLNVVRQAKALSTGPNATSTADDGQIGVAKANWPFIQLYNLTTGGNVEVQYNKGGGGQTATLTFDTVDDFAGIDLDRTTYPQGAQVHVTVTDAWLNIDPTDEDSWTWDTDGNAYYQIFDKNGATPGVVSDVLQVDPVTSTHSLMQEDAVFILTPDQQGTGAVIALHGNDNSPSHAIAGLTDLVTLTELGPKSGVFGSYDESDDSVLRITDDARRGTSAVVDYNDTPTTVLVAHDSATIDIQPSNDDWASGEAIPVVLVDADANKNSRADEDLTLSSPDTALIPSLDR